MPVLSRELEGSRVLIRDLLGMRDRRISEQTQALSTWQCALLPQS